MEDARNEDARRSAALARLEDIRSVPIHAGYAGRERRNMAARRALSERVRHEFVEMPGTSLTLAQAGRLFGVPTESCSRILSELILDGQIRLSPDSRYRVHSAA